MPRRAAKTSASRPKRRLQVVGVSNGFDSNNAYSAYLKIGAPAHLSLDQVANLKRLTIYPGADSDFALYSDDGNSYAYERGDYRLTNLHWDEKAKQLTYTGAAAWDQSRKDVVEIVASAND